MLFAAAKMYTTQLQSNKPLMNALMQDKEMAQQYAKMNVREDTIRCDKMVNGDVS